MRTKILWPALLTLLIACASGDPEASKASAATTCEPGRQIACACAGGVEAYQRCTDDGARWEACQCPETEPGGDSLSSGATSDNSGGGNSVGGASDGACGGNEPLGGAPNGTGGNGTSLGGAFTGGTSGAGAGVVGNDNGMQVLAGGYVISGSWHGYAWTVTEDDGTVEVSSTVSPGDFETIEEGGRLCAGGTVAQDEDYGGMAALGISLNQPQEGVTAEQGTWTPSGRGIAYELENNGTSDLRIQIQGAAGYPDEAWCATVESGRRAVLDWTDFNTQCWQGGDGQAYDGLVPLEVIMVLVPGNNGRETPFDFCIDNLGPV